MSTSNDGNGSAGVAVIGAGGAGLLAGIAAAEAGARTVLYERMKAPAKKVAISGGGRCNFSNTLNPREFVREFGDPKAKNLGPSLRALGNDDLIALLERHGVKGACERHYRLYTESGRGQDVVDALVKEFLAKGGTLACNAQITEIVREGGSFKLRGSFDGAEGAREAKAVIVCTGGLSYPQTGSTGDGYTWARTLGHGVTDLKAALVGLTVEEDWPRALAGTAWPDAICRLWPAEIPGAPPTKRGKPWCEERKEILFTHFGVSGPAILDASNAFVRAGVPRAKLTIDFFPETNREELDTAIRTRFYNHPKRRPSRALEGMLPARLLEAHEKRLFGERPPDANRVPREERMRLIEWMKDLALTVTGTRGMKWGEVTLGGIEWADIDTSTMGSRHVPGLFFAGEILDLAGRCGGFNLQAAFSTGYLAGKSAARFAKLA